MNSNILDILSGKERKRYNQFIDLIKQKKYSELFEMDEEQNFGLTSQKYIDSILNIIKQELLNNPDFLLQMNKSNYHRTDYFNNAVIKLNPKIIQLFIEENLWRTNALIPIALEYGYIPEPEYINTHEEFFSSVETIVKLIERGYIPTNEIVEKHMNVFSDEELLSRVLDLGFVPSLDFIKRTNILNNPNFTERILDTIELTPEVMNSSIFYGNALAQRMIIKKNPELLLSLNSESSSYEQFWIEAFKQEYMPEEILSKSLITSNFLLFSKVIKQRPEMIKYCKLINRDEREKIDELALCMGYVPSISDIKNNEYLQNSPKIIEAMILRRPEAIKYVSSMPSFEFQEHEFFDLARIALDNGYIPDIKDIEENKRLQHSFDIMKLLIQEQPQLINILNDRTPKLEELLKIAIENGFNEEIRPHDFHGKHYSINPLTITETAIMYSLNRTGKLEEKKPYKDNYSINLYRCLKNKGYQTKEIINLFTSNYQVMTEIISESPEYITNISKKMTRNQIDKLGLLAIEKGYDPKFEDDIFGYGAEVAKLMVKKYPSYIEKVDSAQSRLGNPPLPRDIWLEICKIAIDNGFMPDLEKMGVNPFTRTDYNYSYDIVKKGLASKPSLIETCEVAEQEKYDELCRIAISYGYEITDEYVLNHWGRRMYSNYDLMAIYITKKPEAITNVQMSTPEKMLKLIDIAIDSGLQLGELDKRKLFQIFMQIEEEKWGDYLDESTIEDLQKVKELRKNNDEISSTIIPKFLSENITSHLNKIQIEILSCYPNLQEKIIKISTDEQKSELIYELINKYKDNLEWIPILEKVLNNIESPEYANLLTSITDKELTSEEKENLMYLLMTNNHLDISTLDELKNIDVLREAYIEKLTKRNTLGSLKTAYFEKTFGIDLATAINMVNLYGESLETGTINYLDEKSKQEFILLKNMKKIISLNNLEVLKYYVENINPEIIVKPDLIVTYEARLKYLFTEEFNKSITKPLTEDKVVTDISGEEDLDIYLAAGHDGKKKCRMMITSIGAYTNLAEPDDYYASWNIDKIASHGCCCSYVGEKNLGTATIKYCCLGFTDYELGALQLAAPYDLASSSNEESYKISAAFSSMFMLPEDFLEYTRHTHNEFVWERRNISETTKFKKQPSYIVYFVDNFEDRLTDTEAMRQWESVKKAAVNFSFEKDGIKRPLPIMVVEREKIAKAQHEIIQNKLKEFKETLNPQLIKEIVVEYESNYAGNRKYHQNIIEKYFPKHEKLSESLVGEIIETIKSKYLSEPNMAIDCIYELEKIVKKEQEKYNNTQHGMDHSIPSFNIEEALININRLKSSFQIRNDSILSVISNCTENDRQFRKTDSKNISQILLENQLSSYDIETILTDSNLLSTIVMYENEIKEENINGKLKIHGSRHIKNVLLYSAIISKSVIKNEHDLNLIMLSAKYHDIGRKTDAHEEHAASSAKIALEKLKDKCSTEDLSIISTIIEFHEISRNTTYEDEIFMYIARKNGIPENQLSRVRQMSEVLKDADALDRTRFITRARLKPEFLQYDISKKLIKFAATLQETYALEDLKEFHCDETLGTILQTYTPQEVLRTIRHSNRGHSEIESVQNFTRLWADTIEKETDQLQSMLDDSNGPKEEGNKNGKK